MNYNQIKSDEIEISIQPPASILNVFSRLSYKPWYAIAEFVDNSTQSFITHESELLTIPNFTKLIVDVNYDADKNILTITDNAFGMELDRFKDAILLDSRNESQKGRNEFGMGLKTAASWFGKVWSVESTQFGSSNLYYATVDIPLLEELKLQNTIIHRKDVDIETHGTKITIEQVTKKISASRTVGKIRDLLSSMYRRDINNRKIEIMFNGEKISFEDYPVLTNFRNKEWKKDICFEFRFNEKTYNVSGFVGIMNPGSFAKAGFALFRQDRVIIGGNECNYKPYQIFGQAQSQISLKLFGELNMNDFPVNQAKDGFIWDDGLEDEFILELRKNIVEYIQIAELSIKERASEMQFSDQASTDVQTGVTAVIERNFNNIDTSNGNYELKDTIKQVDLEEYINTVLNNTCTEELVSTSRHYLIPINQITKLEFEVQWARGNNKYWIEYSELEPEKYILYINIDHPFFMPFTKEDGFQKVLEKFALSFVLAERHAKSVSDKQGYIQYNVIKHYMNKYLSSLAEE